MILALALAAGLAAQAPADVPQSPQDRIDSLQQVYDESCGSRGYGQYDDVCNAIRDQIKEADKALRQEAAHPKVAKPPSASLAPAPPTTANSTPLPPNTPPGGYEVAPK